MADTRITLPGPSTRTAHGLPNDLSACLALSLRDQVLAGTDRDPVHVLRAILVEVMDYPPCRPTSADSYLPPEFVAAGRAALAKLEEARHV